MSNSWFKKGPEAGMKEKEKNDTIAKMKKEKSIPRFRLKAGESAKVIFVDDEGFYIYEHNIEMNGYWGNYFTCTKEMSGECYNCEQGKKPTFTGYYTIIDNRQFTRKDGTISKNNKILFPAKGTAIKILDDLRKKNGGLVGLAFEIKRYTAEDPNCGINFTLLGKVDIASKLGKENAVPFPYEKVLAPPTDKELEGLGFVPKTVGRNIPEVAGDDLLTDVAVIVTDEEALSDLF
ncbi:MAG: hypothetical protein EPN88_13810 [Bacteroidetes bacterium]|nr:MAG: hypothetical protein EPN88_13810 [Bacteroidota bacterium]